MIIQSYLSLFSLLTLANALTFPIKRVSNPALGLERKSLVKRTSKFQVLANAGGGDDVDLSTSKDLIYMANVSVGGTELVLQLDTGSSDLWVASGQSISNSKASSLTYNLTYGIGWAYGNINQAPVSFAGFTVQSQAYLLASQSQNPISSYGAVGIFGLGFDSLSSIDAAVNSSTSSSQGNAWGRSFLSNAFATDTSSPNFISFVLERDGDPDENGDVQGTFTIGEYASQYAAVANSPAIPTWPENSPKRWSVLLDNFYVGGVLQTLLSSVVGVPDGKVVILLDSGTSYSYASTDIVQAMYGGIKGASFSGGTWSVPCDAEVDVTFSIGGQPFPMHPLDIVSPSVSDPTQCVGTFLAQSLSVGGGEFDWLIGDNVLRSLYSVYDFGDYDSSGNIGNPSIKLLALTNATEASADFHTVRGGNANGTLSASGVNGVALNSSTSLPSTSTASPSSASSKASSIGAASDQSSLDKLLDYMPAILGILGLNSLLLLSLSICAGLFFIRRRSNKSKKGVRGGNVSDAATGGGGAAGSGGYHYARVNSQYTDAASPGLAESTFEMPLAPRAPFMAGSGGDGRPMSGYSSAPSTAYDEATLVRPVSKYMDASGSGPGFGRPDSQVLPAGEMGGLKSKSSWDGSIPPTPATTTTNTVAGNGSPPPSAIPTIPSAPGTPASPGTPGTPGTPSSAGLPPRPKTQSLLETTPRPRMPSLGAPSNLGPNAGERPQSQALLGVRPRGSGMGTGPRPMSHA